MLWGELLLGSTDNKCRSQQVITTARLPDMKSDNCQGWVRGRVAFAVEGGILEKNAEDELWGVPVNGSTR